MEAVFIKNCERLTKFYGYNIQMGDWLKLVISYNDVGIQILWQYNH